MGFYILPYSYTFDTEGSQEVLSKSSQLLLRICTDKIHRMDGQTDKLATMCFPCEENGKICAKKKLKSYAHIVTHAMHLAGEYGNLGRREITHRCQYIKGTIKKS